VKLCAPLAAALRRVGACGTNAYPPGINPCAVFFKRRRPLANLTVSIAMVATHCEDHEEITMSSAPIKIAAALAACLAVAAVANAESAPAVRVSYADLNLSTPQGSRALYARIESAANEVCRAEDIRDLQAMAARRSCRADAIEQAVRAVGSPTLAALYAGEVRHG
jgi:UrcA family protein